MPGLLVGRQLRRQFLGVFLVRVVELFDDLMRIAENAPNDLHADNFWRARSRLGHLRRLHRLGFGDLFLFRLGPILIVVVPGLLVLVAGAFGVFTLFALAILIVFVFFVFFLFVFVLVCFL